MAKFTKTQLESMRFDEVNFTNELGDLLDSNIVWRFHPEGEDKMAELQAGIFNSDIDSIKKAFDVFIDLMESSQAAKQDQKHDEDISQLNTLIDKLGIDVVKDAIEKTKYPYITKEYLDKIDFDPYGDELIYSPEWVMYSFTWGDTEQGAKFWDKYYIDGYQDDSEPVQILKQMMKVYEETK